MKYTVTIKNNLNRENYSFEDPNADLIIEGNLRYRSPLFISSDGITIAAKNVTINGEIDCTRIRIVAESILVNNTVHSDEAIELTSKGCLDLNAEITSRYSNISLKGKQIIFREDIHCNGYSYISADKMLLLGDIKSFPNIQFCPNNYIIKVGSLPIIGYGNSHYFPEKELTDIEKIKDALVDDFNIQEPELSEILDKCKS
ncbi:MAG: hypothetical protein K1060chlam3_00314 [Candidatus Anoxychlamydiales bacterium]|nr:hypothetical protein [Candidatus Anoxychlamydiales bacterium]